MPLKISILIIWTLPLSVPTATNLSPVEVYASIQNRAVTIFFNSSFSCNASYLTTCRNLFYPRMSLAGAEISWIITVIELHTNSRFLYVKSILNFKSIWWWTLVGRIYLSKEDEGIINSPMNRTKQQLHISLPVKGRYLRQMWLWGSQPSGNLVDHTLSGIIDPS